MTATAPVLLGLASVLLVLLLVWERRREDSPHDKVTHYWASVRATTLDGVTATVDLEYVVRDVDPRDHVHDLVEDRVRRAIGSARVTDLPDAGTVVDWAEELPGVSHAVVLASDIWVTPELRRLVAGRGSEAAGWI